MKNTTTSHKEITGAGLKAILFFAVVIMSGKLMSQELVANPGFSNGTTSWNTSCTIEINPESVYGGTGSNPVTEIDVERCINQNVCVFPGSSYNFSFKGSRRADNITAPTVGITVKVTGMQSGIEYVNNNLFYSNTSFALTNQSYSFSLPLNSVDKKVNIQFLNYNNSGTYGVLIDDISIKPTDSLTLVGPDAATINIPESFSVLNTPASGVNYSWNFGANSNPGTSAAAAPSNIKWSVVGYKQVSVGLDNGVCNVITLNKGVILTSILPVKLISFTGEVIKAKSQLSWVANNENKDGKYFIIERAASQNVFDSIGVVAVAESPVNTNYAFSDNSPVAGSNNYRLKLVDINGGFSYSKVISLNGEKAASLQVYPNPAVAAIGYKLTSDNKSEVLVQVYSIAGRMVASKKQHLESGINQGSVDISSLQPGSYFLKLTTANDKNLIQAFCKK